MKFDMSGLRWRFTCAHRSASEYSAQPDTSWHFATRTRDSRGFAL